MSLRDLIEAKSRRSATLPLAVGDVAAAAAAAGAAQRHLDDHLSRAEEPAEGADESAQYAQRTTELREALAAAQEAAAATIVRVTLHGIAADEWDALFDHIEPDADGEVDLSEIHAELLAASCDDEELQDADWWRAQFADKKKWSKGDRAAITNVLLALNVMAPAGAAGKG